MADTPSAESVPPLVNVLWGKTGEVDRNMPDEAWHLLLSHMIDSANVAGEMWDRYLSPAMKAPLDRLGNGRAIFRWLAGLHDLGKASPVHQELSDHHYQRVKAVVPHTAECDRFRHEQISAHVVKKHLGEDGWPHRSAQWVAHILGGHHGTFPTTTHDPRRNTLGGEAYDQARRYLFNVVTEYCGVDLDTLRDRVPALGTQLAFAGAVVMADWLASNSQYFAYDNGAIDLDDYRKLSERTARYKFQEITELNEVWHTNPGKNAEDLYWRRFEIDPPHDTQLLVDEVARSAEKPGLMVVEAPTGNGKTEAALAAAEVLAHRFGFNGLFFALPTQATSNSIFDRVLGNWEDSHVREQLPKPTISLLHGKARLKKEFTELPSGGVADDGCDSLTASSWMRGSKKALLNPFAVGTIDQLLFAGVAARYVQLRHLGLANKVVVIDEVHAYDTYMSKILHRVLHWLGLHGVPVILLSATLPPAQRQELLQAYSGAEKITVASREYPLVTWVEPLGGEDRLTWKETVGPEPVLFARANLSKPEDELPVHLEVPINLEFAPADEDDDLTDILDERLKGSPRANVLVLRNTVKRAQKTYEKLNKRFKGFDIRLAHARFTARDRERIDRELMVSYGPPHKSPERPTHSIVVATQVAEQSLDVDFDLVVSDLAPIDLLLQRAGRCHRHKRDLSERGNFATPTLVITGYQQSGDELPELFGDTRRPYDHHLLYRTLAVLTHPERRTSVSVPRDVPELIGQVYSDDIEVGPGDWQQKLTAAREDFVKHQATLGSHADSVLLAEGNLEKQSLLGIHPYGNYENVPERRTHTAGPARRGQCRGGPAAQDQFRPSGHGLSQGASCDGSVGPCTQQRPGLGHR
jgi:CRISPR-associated helicase Cas3/CRISPR-associated endonuclease Cas3-HD